MKKLLLSSAIAATMGVSGVAQAAIDLNDSDATSNNSLTYASELTIATTGSNLGDSGGDVQDLGATLGFGVSAGATRFIRVDLSNDAEFQNAPSLSVSETGDFIAITTPTTNEVVADDTKDVAAGQITLVQGGAGESFAIFQFTSNGTTTDGDQSDNDDSTSGDISLSQDADIVVDVDGVTLINQSDVTATYALYETGTAAQNQDSTLSSAAAQVAYRFSTALSIQAGSTNNATLVALLSPPAQTNGTVDEIDVTQESKYFEDATDEQVSPFGIAAISLVTPTPLTASSVAVPQLDTIIDDSNVTAVVSGDFSSASGLTNDGDATNFTTASTLLNTDGDAEFVVADTESSTNYTGSLVVYEFLYQTDGTTVIPETTFALTLGLAAQTGYTLASSVGPVEMDKFEKNGSTSETNLQLDPAGAFKNFVRLTNPSGIDGRVFLTVINDDGDSVAINLDDISVQGTAQPASLLAGASTRLIPMSAVIAAAQAQDSTFGIVDSARNKFRIIADGEFGDTADRTAINIDNITLATDNSTFSTF